MTTLAITPNWKNKSAKFKGTVAAGEHVSVTILNDDGEGGEFIADASTLRLRVVNPCNGRTLAIFPEPVPEGETPEAWDVDLSPLRCTLNLNTVQMLKAVPPAANVPLLWVLDDYDNNTLYFKEQFPVEHWPRLRGEEEPTDLDNYKDIIENFNTRLDGYDARITGAENAARAATENASAAAAKANQAVGIANQAVDKAETAQNSAAASAAAAHNSALAAEEAQEAAESAAESINSPDATLTEEGVAADAKAAGEAIAAEKERAETAEAAEETRAKGVESGLRTDLTAAQEAINDEAVLRAAADADLEANKADRSELSAESTRAQTAEAAISSDVAAAQAAIATKADKATTYTKTEVDTKIAGVQTFKKYLVQTLPDPDEADMKGLYLVPTGETSEEGDLCEEWTVVEENGEKRWELIGGTTVDLDNYYTKSEVNGKLDEKQAKLYAQGQPGWTFSTESTGTEIEAFMADAANYSVTEEQSGSAWLYTLTGYDEENYYVAPVGRTAQSTSIPFYVFDVTQTSMYGSVLAEYSSAQTDVPAQVDTTPTANSGRLVTSGGIWSALWGALASLPTGFSSLYDWCVSQLAGKEDIFTPAMISIQGLRSVFAQVKDGTTIYETMIPTTVMLADKLDKSGGTITGDLIVDYYDVTITDQKGIRLIDGPVSETSRDYIYATAYYIEVGHEDSEHPENNWFTQFHLPETGQEVEFLAAQSNIAPAWVSGTAYMANALVTYNGVVYRCKANTVSPHTATPDADTTHWETKPVSDLFVPLTGGTMTGRLDIEYLGSTGEVYFLAFAAGDVPLTLLLGFDGSRYFFLQNSAKVYLPVHNGTIALTAGTGYAGNLAALDAQGNPTNSQIPAANVALKGNIPYDLGTPIVIDTASSETVEGETVYYGAATLADRTANIVQVTAATALDELRITFPAATSGKVRDFGLRVEIGTGSAALAAPALVPIAPTGETIKIENNAAEIPALADGTATARGVTLLYFSENAPGVFVVKGEQVEEVA